MGISKDVRLVIKLILSVGRQGTANHLTLLAKEPQILNQAEQGPTVGTVERLDIFTMTAKS